MRDNIKMRLLFKREFIVYLWIELAFLHTYISYLLVGETFKNTKKNGNNFFMTQEQVLRNITKKK